MSIKVKISSLLSQYTDDQHMSEVSGGTVCECLKYVAEQFPKLKLFDNNDKLAPYLCIIVNEEIVSHGKLDTPVNEGDEVSIILAISGG